MTGPADHGTPQDRDDPLAAHFEAARAAAPVPTDALLAAVLADAARLAEARPPRIPPTPARAVPAATAAALAASLALGFWIGFAGPAALVDGPALVREGDVLLAAADADDVEAIFDSAEEG